MTTFPYRIGREEMTMRTHDEQDAADFEAARELPMSQDRMSEIITNATARIEELLSMVNVLSRQKAMMLAALEAFLEPWGDADTVSERTGFDLPPHVAKAFAAIKVARGE